MPILCDCTLSAPLSRTCWQLQGNDGSDGGGGDDGRGDGGGGKGGGGEGGGEGGGGDGGGDGGGGKGGGEAVSGALGGNEGGGNEGYDGGEGGCGAHGANTHTVMVSMAVLPVHSASCPTTSLTVLSPARSGKVTLEDSLQPVDLCQKNFWLSESAAG